ncbi:MAG: hypothetical protein HOU81_08230 [Hamadaea sp.]|uniref:hypothetical protein n=1 Tax=Hamadaea sp. TaxID=2024425 RepID=UPI001809E26B|nr:hypothetical protein [Hamadaea sp.]NUR70796.1 hypothetical protein [Hamadaea sp.]NUT19495.1 hypothetical protein [Hamadaea sp.]
MRVARPLIALAVVATATALATACSSPPPADDPTSGPVAPDDPRSVLAARAAAAKDLHQTALYALKTTGRPDRTVSVTLAADGGWKVDVPATALGGTVDISLVRTGGAVYQCALPSTARPQSGCVRLSKVASAYDPKLQHLFTDWLEVFMDRQAALAVTAADPLPGVQGTCFTVDTSAVSVKAPVDPGIYCYADNGTLTGARTSVGTLTLVGAPTAGPPTITLPGAVVAGQPLPNASPPAPSNTPSANPSGTPSGKPSGKPSVTPTTSRR